MRHFQALVRIDSSNGNETRVAEYVKNVLEAEGIPAALVAKDPARANLITRLKGNGSRKPLLIMAHTDTVRVDEAKWKFPPFSATRDGGWVYGRGTIDDKSDVVAGMMTMLMLKRLNVALDRDVIFVAEAGEEAAAEIGMEFLSSQHWSEIEAEICIAETGGVSRRNGKPVYAMIETTEKQPSGARLVVKGAAGPGSRPLRSNAIAHLARAVDVLARWEPPTQFNDTTRVFFEKLANVSAPEDAARYRALFDSVKAPAAREYLAEKEPGLYSLLHTSISPNMIQGGYQVNVIPSQAEATLDIRAFPGENLPAFFAEMARIVNDPAVEIVPGGGLQRPAAAPSRIDSEAFRILEAGYKEIYGVETLPYMQTGASDMTFLRAKGVQCYGVGPMTDDEDGAKGFGQHSDQERILEEAVYKHLQFYWRSVTAMAGAPR
ncbi:MAG: M20/M25/M40 family metallo-hydrolase [Acidobacteriota bacterium]